MSQAEAAEVLGVSEGTVAWRMSEVKKRLRAMAREEGIVAAAAAGAPGGKR
jgi:RNA polymerase sigma-70 factor (ECF subfamily)